jgi:hypothetical protein
MSELDPAKVALHNQQVAAGLLPADAPPDFVIPEGGLNEDGLPWWFPPGFRADVRSTFPPGGDELAPDGTPVELAWDYFAHEKAPLLTRESLQEEFSYRITDLSKPHAIPLPKRIWSELQMGRIRRGYEAQVMEEKWHAFMEGDQLFIARSWTGILCYIATFAPGPKGWRIEGAEAESDLDRYYPGSDALASVEMESVVFNAVLGKLDEALEERRFKEMHRWYQGPRIVITKHKGLPIPIVKPGYSIKHGKVATQHPLQREAYDSYFAKGYETAVKALNKGKTPEDVYYSATRHEVKAYETAALESSQHAGLAKGAKIAAWKWSRGEIAADTDQSAIHLFSN